MIGRRSFLQTLSALVTVPVAAAVAIDDGYEPSGLVDTDTLGSLYVDYVTLDGVKQNRVLRLNDVEGWLVMYDAEYIRQYYRRGVVRVYYRAPGAA